MSRTVAAPGAPSSIESALAADKLGYWAVNGRLLASMATLLTVGGLVEAMYAATEQTQVSIVFLMATVVLIAFTVGYARMGREIRNAGAFYAYISKAFSRPMGVSAAFVACVGYNSLQVAIYGLIGTQAASYAHDNFGWHFTWWECAMAVWAIVALLGQANTEVSSNVQLVLSILELLVVFALSVAGIASPAGGHVSYSSLNPTHLDLAGLGVMIAIGSTGPIGFEGGPVLGEETRNPDRTIPWAMMTCLLVIGVLYFIAPFSMSVHYGSSLVATAQGPNSAAMFFALGPGWLGSIGRTLFLTSLLAAALSYHNVVWRYNFALARDGVFPTSLARIGRSGIPRRSSLVQTVIGLGGLAAAKGFHWDPLLTFFYIGGTWGGYIILILLALTAIGIAWHYARTGAGLNMWLRCGLPIFAAVGLVTMCTLASQHLAGMFGVAPNDPTVDRLVWVIVIAAVLGLIRAVVLRRFHPELYASLAGDQRVAPGLFEDAALSGGPLLYEELP